MNWKVHFTLVAVALSFSSLLIEGQEVKCLQNQSHCCDQNQFCTFWSQRGECNRNPSWMLVNCQISCNACSRPQQPQMPPPLAPTPTRAPIPIVNQTLAPLRDSGIPDGCSAVQPMEVFFAPIASPGAFNQGVSRSGCGTPNVQRDCNRNICFHKKFRSMDGVCNNLGKPLVGAAFTPNPRLLPSVYDDGINAVVASLKRHRPNPRQVSVSLLSSSQSFPLNTSSLLMQWAQFLAHDMTQNALGSQCSCSDNSNKCANLPPAVNDPLRLPCTGFGRSIAECGTGFNGRPREQMNLNTAFIDGSAVYGSDFSTCRSLRMGFHLRFVGDFRQQMIPANGNLVFGGDLRAGIFTGLTALQTYMLRLHNKVAAELNRMNPHWNQDRVFEEARKIVGAVIQVITYQEFLGSFLGASIGRLGGYSGYQPNVDPSILNEFSGAAFRLHGMIENSYSMRDANYRPVGVLTFGQGISQSPMSLGPNSLDFIARGLISTPARSPQRLAHTVADSIFNLATFSIQRGRDHGFQGYNAYRQVCGLGAVPSFDQWTNVADPSVIERVKQLYPMGVDTLDLYVGGLLEKPQGGAAIGPTFACIISEQFKRLRDGDRFFFENPETFTNEQLIALRRVTISWVICSNSDSVHSITRTAFHTDAGSTAVPCNTLQQLDLTPWRE